MGSFMFVPLLTTVFSHDKIKFCVSTAASIASVTVTMGSWTAGGSVGLECMVQGDPKPTVKWSCSNDCGVRIFELYRNTTFLHQI